MTFDDCLVFQGRHLLEGTSCVPESLVDHPEADRLAARIADLGARISCPRWPIDERAGVVIGKWGSGNYGHMLTDIAPKLLNLARARLGAVRLHLPDNSANFLPLLRDLSTRLALDVEFRVAACDELARFERVLFLPPVAKHARRKSEALRGLRDLMLGAYGESGARRLFVTRRAAEPRAIANQADIASIFVSARLDTWSPPAARVVATPHDVGNGSPARRPMNPPRPFAGEMPTGRRGAADGRTIRSSRPRRNR